MNLKCMIVDDEPVARKLLKEYVADVSFLDFVGEAENPLKAQTILDNWRVDLMFLDINMPRMTGIEFLRSIPSLPMVILTTAYEEYAIEGFNLDVFDYLVKPFSFERFLKACNKAKDYHRIKKAGQATPPAEDYFFVKCNNRIEKITHEELLYVEASLNYITLHTSRGKMIVYLTMKGITENLPGEIFLRVHKSYLVNVSKINSIEGNILHIGSTELPISQNSYEEVIKIILKDRMIRR